jgi:hypothetical protein
MISFKIEEKEYQIPDYISIENYVKLYKLKDMFSDDYYAAKLINIFTEAPVEQLLECDYNQINYLASYIMSLFPSNTKQPLKERFEIDGIHYGFFPNWRDLTFAEFVDMDTISTKKEKELLDLLHILMAVMYRPIVDEETEHKFKIEKYDVKTLEKRAEIFKKKLDINIVLGAQFFFINYAKKYSAYSQLSLIPKIPLKVKIKLIWKMRKIMWAILFKKSTVGSLSPTDLLTMILQSTNQSIKKT